MDVAAAAVVAQPFALYLAVRLVIAPPTAEQWAHVDPILRWLGSLWLIPIFSAALAFAWWRAARPDRATLGRAVRHALLGALAAIVLVAALRARGASLPSFVPPEESAGPGLTLSLAAGYTEELLCRLALLPLLARRNRALAVALTGLAFAALHGPAPLSFVLTRALVPGAVFSLVALWSPAFLVVAHATAHLLLPLVFA